MKTHLLPIILVFIFMMPCISIHAQSDDALTITHNCTTNCLDLEINGGYPSYDVEWQTYNTATAAFTTLAGWPKTIKIFQK